MKKRPQLWETTGLFRSRVVAMLQLGCDNPPWCLQRVETSRTVFPCRTDQILSNEHQYLPSEAEAAKTQVLCCFAPDRAHVLTMPIFWTNFAPLQSPSISTASNCNGVVDRVHAESHHPIPSEVRIFRECQGYFWQAESQFQFVSKSHGVYSPGEEEASTRSQAGSFSDVFGIPEITCQSLHLQVSFQ